jgi:hypothetical protein
MEELRVMAVFRLTRVESGGFVPNPKHESDQKQKLSTLNSCWEQNVLMRTLSCAFMKENGPKKEGGRKEKTYIHGSVLESPSADLFRSEDLPGANTPRP